MFPGCDVAAARAQRLLGCPRCAREEDTDMLRAPGVVLINPKFPHNVGATIRACSCFGVESLVWTGLRVDASKYRRLPREERMKGYKSVTFSNNQRPFYLFEDFTPVCVEVFEQSEPLTTFEHPENAVYVFGPEDGGVPEVIACVIASFTSRLISV
jgi:tRNA(Leu) C34 or U34 (ribose-2'-O)-methylase TrmL